MQLRMAAASIVGELSGQLSHQGDSQGRQIECKETGSRKRCCCRLSRGRVRKNLGQNLVATVGKGPPKWRGRSKEWVRAGSRYVASAQALSAQPAVQLQPEGFRVCLA